MYIPLFYAFGLGFFVFSLTVFFPGSIDPIQYFQNIRETEQFVFWTESKACNQFFKLINHLPLAHRQTFGEVNALLEMEKTQIKVHTRLNFLKSFGQLKIRHERLW